jgi:hypothetical protein
VTSALAPSAPNGRARYGRFSEIDHLDGEAMAAEMIIARWRKLTIGGAFGTRSCQAIVMRELDNAIDHQQRRGQTSSVALTSKLWQHQWHRPAISHISSSATTARCAASPRLKKTAPICINARPACANARRIIA